MSAPRSNQSQVRNPILALPAAVRLKAALDAAPPEVKSTFRDLLGEIAADARERGDKAWAKHKGPMAAYWKANSVYARHIRRATA